MQRGHGLGSELSGLFRNVWPLIRNGLRSAGSHTFKTGVDVANDIVALSSFKESAKKASPQRYEYVRFISIWSVWMWQEKETHLVEV